MQELYNSFYPVEEISKIETIVESVEDSESVEITENSERTGSVDDKEREEIGESDIELVIKEEVSEVHTGENVKPKKTLLIIISIIGIGVIILLCAMFFYRGSEKEEQHQYQNQSGKIVEQVMLSEEEAEEAYAYYGEVIVHMVEDNNLPYIDEEIFDSGMFQNGDLPSIYAAIQDIDRDGIKELVLRIETGEGINQDRQVLYQYDVSQKNVILEMNVNAVGDFYAEGYFIATNVNTEETIIMLYNEVTGQYEKEEYDSEDEDLMSQYIESTEAIAINYSKVAVH